MLINKDAIVDGRRGGGGSYDYFQISEKNQFRDELIKDKIRMEATILRNVCIAYFNICAFKIY